jgi:prophage regulatory protein
LRNLIIFIRQKFPASLAITFMIKKLKTFLRLRSVLEVTGLSRSQIYVLEKNGRFPARISIGARAVAWDSDEIAIWQQCRIDERVARNLDKKK